MDNFVTWQSLAVFGTLVTLNFAVVEFIKELPFINKLRTKYLSWVTAFLLITVTNFVTQTFVPIDLVLYAISAILVSTSGNGLSDLNHKVDKTKKDIK